MKLKLGQFASLAFALGTAALLVYDAPFEAAAADVASTSSATVVYAPVFDPPVIAGVPGKVDLPLLGLELAFVIFVAGAIFIASGQQGKES